MGAAHGTRRGTRAAAKRTGQSGLAAAARSARGCEWGARREHAAARGSTAQQRAQQNLFSSQAGSGPRPAGTSSSSVAAPQGREADISADAARQRKREGGRSSAEGCWLREVAAALLRIAGLHTEGMQLTSWN